MKPYDALEAIRKAEEDLLLIDKSPFTNDGFDEYKKSIARYIKDLLLYSIKEAERNNIKNVSAAHVSSAAQFLVKFKNDKRKDLYNSLSGLFLGVAISNVYTYVTSSEKQSVAGVVFTVVSAILGAYMLGVNFKSND